MARLIEITRARETPAHLSIRSGDVIMFKAVGAVVCTGADIIEALGPFRPAVIAPDGSLISPEGPPNTVIVLARGPGSATLEVISGEPWRNTERTVLEITVAGP
jgi:hypothetical protein